ncbi:acyltransferase [Bradyrhizobium sp. Tv2a-2]|uniref:acyltransferase family protein n=1 Tax=Bradyrhizobium sp. Tv2a-2 TaxID=113395 RepID=UPI0018DDB40F|nr:acyltransferase [Bradyrhizobium sp. Tv2a-2]
MQVLRAIAALGVVIYHTDIRINGVHSELMGVSIFFVISGFIMVHITRGETEDFLAKRLIRIVPIYWIFTLGAVAWFGFGFANLPRVVPLWFHWLLTKPWYIAAWFGARAWSLCSKDTAVALARSLSFWPNAQDPLPILGVGWTLNIEMFFYVLFALCLRAGERLAPPVSAAILVGLFFLNASGAYPNQVLATYGHDYVIFFVLGMVCYYAWQFLMPTIERHRLTATVLACCVLALWPLAIFIPIPLAGIRYYLPPAVVLSALVLHSAGRRIDSRLLIDLGGASFALYLIHIPVLESLRTSSAIFPILKLATPTGALIAACLSSSLAMIAYYRLELPLLRSLHSRLKSANRTGRRIHTNRNLGHSVRPIAADILKGPALAFVPLQRAGIYSI